MTEIQIMEKAIGIARSNGWRLRNTLDDTPPKELLYMFKLQGIDAPDEQGNYKSRCAWETLVYSHKFAKALWGNGPNCAYCKEPPRNMHKPGCIEGHNIWPKLWEYHLQQMVISEKPIKYLGDNI